MVTMGMAEAMTAAAGGSPSSRGDDGEHREPRWSGAWRTGQLGGWGEGAAIPLLRYLESSACYFYLGSFGTHRYETCNSGKQYRELAYVISFAPYYWRAMQCARRCFDEYDLNHLANLGKYVSALVAAGARITYARQPTTFWMIVVLVTSLVATVYQMYWDFVKDWGLLNPRSENPWLRDNLILKKKSIYYMSIDSNMLECLSRDCWNFFSLHWRSSDEVIGISTGWRTNILDNAGKHSAVEAVPLPFTAMIYGNLSHTSYSIMIGKIVS
ncbi:hypothetical protein RJ639_017790 [Escallonia herrerae]|uniref:EXS domain-containing protein n=1 Tax=Escallonia herrerae TaxID=1293975 RepID=A0AA88VC89_9ASTE|nr:hypothetical protein RJ639_017790 [Escallonia herrerae]